jgi:hypothetical protein
MKKSNKCIEDFDNNDLWKIFEYFTCVKLSNEYKEYFKKNLNNIFYSKNFYNNYYKNKYTQL